MTELPARAGDGDRDAAEALLRELGTRPGERLPLAEAAFALSARRAPRPGLARYREHLALLADQVGEAARGAHGLAPRIAALNAVLFQRHRYAGDTLTYEDPQNADLIRVIDRRKGLPVALGILAIHVARAQGWEMAGLALPGHFLVRVEYAGERAILDPFNGGRTRDATELRELLRAMAGIEDLAPQHYAPVSDRDVLLRLQNNLKLRYLESQAPAEALGVLEGMLLIAPMAGRLWHEAALLHAEFGNLGDAAHALEHAIALATDADERRRAAHLLERCKLRLN